MIPIRDIMYLRKYYKDNNLSFLRGIGIRRRDCKTPDYRRVLRIKDTDQDICDTYKIINADRLDIAAKTLFARLYIEQTTSLWPEKVYKEHLRAWNNFYEDEPRKETYEDFKKSFIGLIEDYLHNNINHADSPVVINKVNGVLRNGAHRVAAATVTNSLINIVYKTSQNKRMWNADFFKGRLAEKPEFPLDEKYIDAMTIEYVSIRSDDLFAVVIFPAAKGYRKEARLHLESIGRIVNHRSFKYSEFDAKNIIRQLYYGEEWNFEESEGVSNKAEWCFSGKGSLHVYIVESNLNQEERIKEKEYLRSIWRVDKNSIHMTDTPEEVNTVARMFFHEATRQTLRSYHAFSPNTLKLFNQYRGALPNNFIDRDKFCIDSSAVLDFFGLRQAADLDYISTYNDSNLDIEDIEEHKGKYVEYYPVSKDDMILNPDCHFFYAGCKLLKLDLVASMKTKRADIDTESRKKDLNDVSLIEKYLKTKEL